MIVQRKCACGGECQKCHQEKLGKFHFVQPKLAVNPGGDVFEQEADRIAEEVVARPQQRSSTKPTASALVHTIQRAGAMSSQQSTPPPIVHEVLGSPGHAFDTGTRTHLETRFGEDFGGVRVHTDVQAAASADAIGAQAYTVGQHIVFGEGNYRPESTDGKKLLAHELVHTLQQRDASTVVQRQATRLAASPAVAEFLRPGWTDVHEVGIVWREGTESEQGGATIYETPVPYSNPIEWLPQQTKVYILRQDKKGKDGWYAVTAIGKTTQFGYIPQIQIWRNLPDPNSVVRKTKPGDTALGLVREHYAAQGFDVWGKDMRYVVNAVAWVNEHAKHNTRSALAFEKKEWGELGKPVKSDDDAPWWKTAITPNIYFWLPGKDYLNAIYEEVVKAVGSTGSITADLWRSVKKIYYAAAYGLAFVGGLVHGFLKSLWDAIAGLANMLYEVLKSLVTGHIFSDIKELASKVEGLHWKDIKDAVGAWAAEWADKLDSDSPWTAGHAHGYLTGYVMAEAAMLLIGGGVIEEAKGALWASKLGKGLSKTRAFKNFAKGVAKLGEAGEKAQEVVAKVRQAIRKTPVVGKAAAVVGTGIVWTVEGVAAALDLPRKIAHYLTKGIVDGLKRFGGSFERIKHFSERVKLWLFRCHSPCKFDLDAIGEALKLTDEQIVERAEQELGAEAAGKPVPSGKPAEHGGPHKADPAPKPPDAGAGEKPLAKAPSPATEHAKAKLTTLETNYTQILDNDIHLKLKLEKLKLDLANPATAGKGAKGIAALEDELIESAIAQLQKRHHINNEGGLRKHLHEHPEQLADVLEMETEGHRHQPPGSGHGKEDIPTKLEAERGGSQPSVLGNEGKDLSRAVARDVYGERWIADELEFTVRGPNGDNVVFRADIGTIGPTAQPQLVEAKFGGDAGLTDNQAIGYPIVSTQGATPSNAAARAFAHEAFPAWQPGQPIPALRVRIDYWLKGKRTSIWLPPS
jgi:hypothetical protein